MDSLDDIRRLVHRRLYPSSPLNCVLHQNLGLLGSFVTFGVVERNFRPRRRLLITLCGSLDAYWPLV